MATLEPQTLRSSILPEPVSLSSRAEELHAGNEQATDCEEAPISGVSVRTISAPCGWKRRLEDPLNTFYRYPVALWIVRALMRTPITPNQVSMVQPLLALGAAYLVTFDDVRHLLLAVLLFETRSILDCVDGSLARAKGLSSPYGHAIDAMADWLGVAFLYVGLIVHFYLHPVDGYGRLAQNAILLLAVAQGALRSFTFDYFKTKFVSLYESGRDDSIEGLRAKVDGVTKQRHPSVFAVIDVFIGRVGHACFEQEWFDPASSQAALCPKAIDRMRSEEDSTRTKVLGFLWSVTGGDAFLSLIMLSIVAGQIWSTQLFFATAGWLWILATIGYSLMFVRAYRRPAAT